VSRLQRLAALAAAQTQSDAVFVQPFEDVTKHPGHPDQKVHGKRSIGSIDPSVAQDILRQVKENGGLSVKVTTGELPTGGFMVARDSNKYGLVVKAEDFFDPVRGPRALADHLKANRSTLGMGKAYLGVWHQTSKVVDGKEVPLEPKDQLVHLDVTDNVGSRERAVSLGRRRDQISVWDVANFEEVQTGGSGGTVSKGRAVAGGGDAEADDGDVGRRNRSMGTQGVGVDDGQDRSVIVKHLQGKHNQKDHSGKGGGAYSEWGAREAEIEAMSHAGPSSQELADALAETPEIDDALVRDYVENVLDYRIEERMARDYAFEAGHEGWDDPDNPDEHYSYESFVHDRRDDYVRQGMEDWRDEIEAELRADGYGSEISQSHLIDGMDEVYGITHTGVNADGESVVMRSRVQSVYTDGEGLHVVGSISGKFEGDINSNDIGEFHRVFKPDGTVEHKLLFIHDPDYRATGFAGALNRQAENYYISHGIDTVTVYAGMQNGGYAWASQGFDWGGPHANPDFRTGIPHDVHNQLRQWETAISGASRPEDLSAPGRGELLAHINSIVTRANNLDIDHPDYPTPSEVASLGKLPGMQESVGRTILMGSSWRGSKTLSPYGGRRTSGDYYRSEFAARIAEARAAAAAQPELPFAKQTVVVLLPRGQTQ